MADSMMKMHKGKGKKGMFGKKDKANKKSKFSLFKKKTDTDNDGM